MVRLTRINHAPLVLNSDLIEHIEATPDTVISLTNGQKFLVLESAEEIIGRVIEFRRAIFYAGFNSCAPSGHATAALEANHK
jgi:flagellar protein FlbD